MTFARLLPSALLCLCACMCAAQDKKYDLSAAIDLPQSGVNKVLYMKNGNTMLFHFEPAKKINVIVFDSTHKQIANVKEHYDELDILSLEHVVFKGLFEINNEAVLFFDQDKNSKHGLVRLRYNSRTGTLVEEKLVAESQSEDKRMQFYVMKDKDSDHYSILFCTDKRHPVKECDLYVVFFNEQHKAVKEVQLLVDRKKFDYLNVVGAETQPNGTLITLALAKTVINGLATNMQADNDMSAVYDHFMQYFYIPKNDTTARSGIISLSKGVFAQYACYTHNSFANALNLLLYSYKPIDSKFGLHEVWGGMSRSLFFKFDEADLSTGLNDIKNKLANDQYKQNTDTGKFYIGTPLHMFTNDNGLTTLVSQSFTRNGEPETQARYNHEDFYGNICVTQLDDNGNELWGTVLPCSQYYKSYEHYVDVNAIATRWQSQLVFGDMPPQVYNRQFTGINTYHTGNNCYIVYNDYNKNFNNTLKAPGDTVYTFGSTNACYYKVDKKNEVTKHYVFGSAADKDHKCSFIEGADFNERTGVYASLIQYKKGEKISLRMAWSHLE